MSLSLERLARGALLPSFTGTAAPDWILRELDAGAAGVVLFATNVADRGQLLGLTRQLRAARPAAVIAIDEEGGDVTRLEAERGSSYPAHAALGAVDDPGLTRKVARSIAAELAAVGVNLNLAPVADVNTNPLNPVIGVRSFGSDPARAAVHVAAFVEGLQRGGVAACAKHFPGHGDTRTDSHLEAPVVDADRATLAAGPLLPFAAAIEVGVRAIMTAHIVVPALDDVPATLSRVILTDLLRDELGFGGTVITDALDMRAISAGVGVEGGAVRSLAAGADALCLGPQIDEAGVGRIVAGIAAAVRDGRLQEERLAEAAVRAAGTAASLPPGGVPDGEVGAGAARRALEVEGTVAPLDGPVRVVELQPEANIAAGPFRHGLGQALREAGCDVDVVQADSGSATAVSFNGSRRTVLVLRDAHRHDWQRAAAERLLATHPESVVVETGIQGWRPPTGAAYIVTHGAGRASVEAVAGLLTGSPA